MVDISCLVSDTASSTQAVLDRNETFSQISGYKIIWNKLEVMSISNLCHSATVGGGQFQWIIISYLVVKLCANTADIIHINMDPLLMKVKQ